MISKDIYNYLKSVGKDIFAIMGDEINEISNEYIRIGDYDRNYHPRREVDFDEMCMAMGLVHYKMMRVKDIWFGNPDKKDGFPGLDSVMASGEVEGK